MSSQTAQRPLLVSHLSGLNDTGSEVPIYLSQQLIRLLSDQLYQSPLKAIEELVVNAYDADASICRIFVPDLQFVKELDCILVYDDGTGMNLRGLEILWRIGDSTKRTPEVEKARKRKQIGKFGIGKLATHAIANHLTHISKADDRILVTTVNYEDFTVAAQGARDDLKVPVREIPDIAQFIASSGLENIFASACIQIDELREKKSWTVVALESLKPEKLEKLTLSGLKWVLSTAMPLKDDFRLFLNCEEIASSKEKYEVATEFELHTLPEGRLEALKETTGETWTVREKRLVSTLFPSGISGSVMMTTRVLTGKSDDLGRSHGFFVRVLDRLVNEDQPLFGLTALTHGRFNRFRADIHADDLDEVLKASRETLEDSKIKSQFRDLLRTLFNEANSRYEEYLKQNNSQENKEGKQAIVAPTLVEYPTADALMIQLNDFKGSEADNKWFYIETDPKRDVNNTVGELVERWS